jgi:hypothetical protein
MKNRAILLALFFPMRGLVNEVGTAIKAQNSHIYIPDFKDRVGV